MSNRIQHDCNEYRDLSRRGFLRGASLASAASLTAPAWLPQVALGSGGGGPARDVVIHVFLRGAMDGISACVPYGDPALIAARPNLAIPPPGQSGGALDLDGFFGLNPAMQPLMEAWNAGHLAIVHATGSLDPTRSHFDAMKAMERGVPGYIGEEVLTGWLGRQLAALPATGVGLLRAMALEDLVPRALFGAPGALPVADPAGFDFPGNPGSSSARKAVVESMHQRARAPLAESALTTFDTIDLLQSIDFDGYVPAAGALYPPSVFGQKLERSAALIRADVGVEVISIDYPGWDHHNAEGPQDGLMAGMLADLATSLGAFHRDLGDRLGELTVVVMSEFGRRVAENVSLGADHGHGSCHFYLGGNVVGGVHGIWPTLEPANLNHGDLAITTDHRHVLAELLSKRMGVTDLTVAFPDLAPVFPGVFV